MTTEGPTQDTLDGQPGLFNCLEEGTKIAMSYGAKHVGYLARGTSGAVQYWLCNV